jgi:hypothetical protein
MRPCGPGTVARSTPMCAFGPIAVSGTVEPPGPRVNLAMAAAFGGNVPSGSMRRPGPGIKAGSTPSNGFGNTNDAGRPVPSSAAIAAGRPVGGDINGTADSDCTDCAVVLEDRINKADPISATRLHLKA